MRPHKPQKYTGFVEELHPKEGVWIGRFEMDGTEYRGEFYFSVIPEEQRSKVRTGTFFSFWLPKPRGRSQFHFHVEPIWSAAQIKKKHKRALKWAKEAQKLFSTESPTTHG